LHLRGAEIELPPHNIIERPAHALLKDLPFIQRPTSELLRLLLSELLRTTLRAARQLCRS
jgi:hypothetical protein